MIRIVGKFSVILVRGQDLVLCVTLFLSDGSILEIVMVMRNMPESKNGSDMAALPLRLRSFGRLML